jgi:phospholipase C
MFGGRVRRTVDSRRCVHSSITKTALQLLGLPALGVPRVDLDAGLADLVDATIASPVPPAHDHPAETAATDPGSQVATPVPGRDIGTRRAGTSA